MNLIKVACVMLAIACLLGILTSGGKDEAPAVSTEAVSPELVNETVNSDASGVTGTVQAEEKSAISEPAAPQPAPDPAILEKGDSKLAGERKNIEKR